MKIKSLTFNSNNSLIRKIKYKKCRNCKYAFINGNIFACQKSNIYIEPLHLICFKKKRKE